ncbi:DNA repair protein RAD57 [Xylariaceae sp. FL0016]|nr:DNA repair protein RAD57 [Xylariaceae sp. FL0016]
MTDLSQILPDFPTAQYARLLPAIEKQGLTVIDLITLDVPDIGKRTQLSLLDIKRLCNAMLHALQADLGVAVPADERQRVRGRPVREPPKEDEEPEAKPKSTLRHTGPELFAKPWNAISTLDASLDAALGGGIPTGYITEITGESGAGKTQFLLTLLLAAQLPPPHGLGRPALYISTEAPLSTKRLSQVLRQHPFLSALDPEDRPSLDAILSTVTPDLESQDHILHFQVPVEVARRDIGLIVVDSVAANYRAEFERGGAASSNAGSSGSNMAARSNGLVRLGALLHELARKYDLAVVVANQVADRFNIVTPNFLLPPRPSNTSGTSSAARTMPPSQAAVAAAAEAPPLTQESPLKSRSHPGQAQLPPAEPTSSMADVVVRSSMPEPPPDDAGLPPPPPALLLDHQQRWFTGWGDDLFASAAALKTPSLGLVWSTQVAARIALFRRPAYGPKTVVEYDGTSNSTATADDYDDVGEGGPGLYIRNWRRWMKVVFAPHVPGTGPGIEGAVEFEVTMGGLRGVERKGKGKGQDNDEGE